MYEIKTGRQQAQRRENAKSEYRTCKKVRQSFNLKFFAEIIQLNTMVIHFWEVHLGEPMPVTFGGCLFPYLHVYHLCSDATSKCLKLS